MPASSLLLKEWAVDSSLAMAWELTTEAERQASSPTTSESDSVFQQTSPKDSWAH